MVRPVAPALRPGAKPGPRVPPGSAGPAAKDAALGPRPPQPSGSGPDPGRRPGQAAPLPVKFPPWLLPASGAALLGLALAVIMVVRAFADLPDARPLRDPAWVSQRFGLKEWTPLEACSPEAVRAILLSEDDTFYQNNGLRPDEIGSAAWDDLLSLRYERGASSLTQQVVKNAFLGKEKTLSRKLREMALALKAGRQVEKRRLLEDYLNLAELGPHKERGIAWAARAYFGCGPGSLNARDGALLSWILPDPKGRGRLLLRGELPRRAKRHVRILLDRLAAEGTLSVGEAKALAGLPYPFERNATPNPPLGGPQDDGDDGE